MDEDCLLEVVSHIEGRNATVRVFPNRVEWDRKGGVSKGKAWLGVATAGLSLAATGIRSGRGSTEMIPIASLHSVTTEKDGLQMKVRLITSGNTSEMRVSKDEANQLKDTLTRLMLGTHPSQAARAAQPAPPPPPPPVPPSSGAGAGTDDIVDQIRKLADLRDAGILSAEEFEDKKRELLSRI